MGRRLFFPFCFPFLCFSELTGKQSLCYNSLPPNQSISIYCSFEVEDYGVKSIFFLRKPQQSFPPPPKQNKTNKEKERKKEHTHFYLHYIYIKFFFFCNKHTLKLLFFFSSEYDGLFLSNGPGDPTLSSTAINNIRRHVQAENPKPLFGICLGHQLLSLAIGCKSFKMKQGFHL